ncbi:hypothetical protein D0T11_04910 [Hymenobacter rubripertinctus]|uniref:Uncharacterized protein n=1 Tax=Hymenobacter rubripertinctus TaxID=2029981 RepID=A0A418R4U2_9BACT|nr:hypothetical protein D0T11_04910 [Hymenobacter rubripertinctus]
MSTLANSHWREVAEYDRFVLPLLVRLESVDWGRVLAVQKARWHRGAINALRAKGQPLNWAAPRNYGGPWGSRFQFTDLQKPNYTLAGYKQREYEIMLEMWGGALGNSDVQASTTPDRRQFLAGRLRTASRMLSQYVETRYLGMQGVFVEEKFELEHALAAALAGKVLDPSTVGKTEANLTHFRQALTDFHEAERPAPAAAVVAGVVSSSATPAPNPPPACPFAPLLLNYSLAELTALLKELGLIDPNTGKATPAASPGAWIGVVYGLMEAAPPRLRNNKRAARQALVEIFGAVVSESALNKGLGKNRSEAERFRDTTLKILG